MSEAMLVRHCSPTLAGLKTGNLFTCRYADAAAMRDSFRRFNRLFGKKGLRALPLQFRDGSALVYIYRRSHLVRDLQNDTAAQLLYERGYEGDTPERYIRCLMRRLAESGEFPHEIGLFLGYPPEDVRGFIENRAGGCKLAGCWKVYGDPEAAAQLFAQYKKCTDVYRAKLAGGQSLERLAVAG